jgi:hypothetical protein
MKTVMSLTVLMAAGFASLAQVEVDDMYFNRKDRAKLREGQEKEIAQRDLKMNEESRRTLAINPTDSYSSRNINPEYTSRQKTSPSNNNAQEDQGYFPAGYQQPVGVNQTLRNSNYYGYNNPYYGNSYYGNAWANPYYGYSSGFGSPYSSFWGSPFGYGGSGWSMSFGNNWGYPGYGWNSWGMPSSMFWNSYYGNSFYNSWGWGYGGNMWGSNYWGGYNPYYGYSNYYGGGYYPVVDNGRPKPMYGKRSDRSNSLSNDVDTSRPISSVTRAGREISNGRTRSETNNQPTYYERSWRQNQEVAQTRSFWGQESGQSRTYQNSNSGRQSSFWDNNNGFDNNNRSSQNRSWSNDNSSFSGGSRSHSSPSPSHSSGGTRSRGRD